MDPARRPRRGLHWTVGPASLSPVSQPVCSGQTSRPRATHFSLPSNKPELLSATVPLSEEPTRRRKSLRLDPPDHRRGGGGSTGCSLWPLVTWLAGGLKCPCGNGWVECPRHRLRIKGSFQSGPLRLCEAMCRSFRPTDTSSTLLWGRRHSAGQRLSLLPQTSRHAACAWDM